MATERIGHFEGLFEYTPTSLWEEDYSGIKGFFDDLRAHGVVNLEEHLDKNPGDVEFCMKLIKVNHVNRKTLEMFKATSEAELLDNLGRIFRDEMREHFRNELLALWNGQTNWVGEGINYTLQNEPLNIRLHWQILPECKKNWECVMVAIEDITMLKKAERRFQDLFTHAPISLWEEDYHGIKELFDTLRDAGVTDLSSHILANPELIGEFMRRIRVIDVNQKTLELFGVDSKETLLANLNQVFRDEMGKHFLGELADMWNGKTSYEREGVNYSLSGDPFDIHLDWRLMPGHEEDFSWVLVAIQDITARKKAEEYMRYLGTHDVMTSLYNRAFFEDEMLRLANSNGKVSFVMIDLNGLKYINDTLGHQAGDNLIRRATEVLKAAFSKGEVVARIGGDEFVAVMENHVSAQEIIERMPALTALNNKYYQGPELSLSLGYATRKEGESLAKTLVRADEEMYKNKEAQYRDNPSWSRRKGI